MYQLGGWIGAALMIAGALVGLFKRRNGAEQGTGLLVAGIILLLTSSLLWGPK